MLRYGILGLLNYGEMTGYEIMQVFRDSLSYFWYAQTSQIYRELKTLEKDGFVTERTVRQTDKPDKNIFTITDAGRQELLGWLSLTPDTRARSRLMMQVFFLGERTAEENLLWFRNLRDGCLKQMADMAPTSGASRRYGERIEGGLRTLYWDMTIDYGLRTYQMLLDWCESCIKKLEELT